MPASRLAVVVGDYFTCQQPRAGQNSIGTDPKDVYGKAAILSTIGTVAGLLNIRVAGATATRRFLSGSSAWNIDLGAASQLNRRDATSAATASLSARSSLPFLSGSANSEGNTPSPQR